MQTDGNKDFDLMLRSMMENAQEEVPSRVWDSVSSRLDAAAARRPRVVVLRWAGAVASAAAAIALGVLLMGGKHEPSVKGVNTLADIQESEVEVVVPSMASEEKADEGFAVVETPSRSSVLAQVLPSRSTASEKVSSKGSSAESVQSAAETEVLPEKSVVEPSEEVSPEEPFVPSQEDVRTAIADQTPSVPIEQEGAGVDPFAQMEWEDSHNERAGRLSVSLGGNVQSNGSPSPTEGFNPRMAPGSAPTESSVQEVSKESNYSVPYSVGLGIRIPLSPRWSIGTGINYSSLQRTFNGTYTEVENGVITRKVNADIHNTLHYIGVPVNFYYNIFSSNRLGLYSFAGGTVEKGIRNNYRIPASPSDAHFHQSVDGVQFSAAAGLGLQFRLAGGLNVYFDPSLRYYFDCGQPTSIRTQMPLLMNLEAGLRFDIK